MSKFINTKQKVILQSLVDGFKEKLNNPYYIHMDKKPNVTCYYNQNIHASTLDEGSKLQYSPLGSDSPSKYNMVKDFYMYGIEKIIVDYDNGDWGLEAGGIEGEAIILPNTIIPIANDYFTINHVDQKLLFKVTSVTPDTIENGANFYKIQYKLDQLTDEAILKQVAEEYTMVINNVGTQFNTIIRKNDYDFVDKVEAILERLKTYYVNLFYSSRVQTFILYHNDEYFYDPYLIEFLKRNDILGGIDNYIYISHQTSLSYTFALDYDRTFFRYVELPDMKSTPLIYSQGKYIDDKFSIFESRKEEYFRLEYVLPLIDRNRYMINNFNIELFDKIQNNDKYKDRENSYKNIIIKYFNSEDINVDDIERLDSLDYFANLELFYNIPIIIYIIENMIKNLLR